MQRISTSGRKQRTDGLELQFQRELKGTGSPDLIQRAESITAMEASPEHLCRYAKAFMARASPAIAWSIGVVESGMVM